jgi:hypothetical protein
MLKRHAHTISTSLIAFALTIFLFTPTNRAYGQLGDLGDLFEGGLEDAQLLFTEYLRPFANGFGAGLNSGWTDRARTHRVLGFHVKINFSAAVVPDVDRSFMVNEIGLTTLEVTQGGPETPTFSGSSSGDVRLGYSQYGLTLADFRMPPGTGSRYIMTPMVQAGLGLPKNTDVMIRFVPPLSFLDYGEMYLYGLGFKHEINQWLPGGDFFPVTLSLMAGYTSFGTSAGLNARPTDFDPQEDRDPNNLGGPDSDTWDGQEINFRSDAWTVNILVGKSLPVISVFGGVGVEGSKTSVTVEGEFPYYRPEPYDGDMKRELNSFPDPLDISFDGANRFRAMDGLRVSLPLFTFSLDYTHAEYGIVTAALGVSFR